MHYFWTAPRRLWEVDGTGSGSCPIEDFGFSGVEPSSSVTRVSVNIGFGGGRWMELAQDRVQSRTLVLAVLNRLALLPECQLM